MSGFQVVYNKNGIAVENSLSGGIESGYATTISKGDPVTLVGGFLVKATVGDQSISGIFNGVNYTDSTGKLVTSPVWVGATVATDIVAFYDEVIADNVIQVVADGAVDQTDLGSYINWAAGTPNLRSGQSGANVAIATINTSPAGLDFKIIGILEGNTASGGFNEFSVNPTKVLVTPLRAGNEFVA